MVNRNRLIKTFIELVKIDSLSLHEGKVMDYLTKELNKLGIRNYISGKVKGGEVGNLFANIPGNGILSPRILLNAHVDTVTPGKNIKPKIKNGYIFSNGKTVLGADNKAGVAAILEIIRSLKEQNIKHPPLQLIFTVAEEIGIYGARAIAKNKIKADFALVLDGGDIDSVIVKAPTQVNLTATIFGRAAHAGLHPEDGINAIKVASQAIVMMKQGRIDHETTSNIGIIKGGKATNIIPDEVEIKGEARSHDKMKLNAQVLHFKSCLQKACRKYKAKLKIKAHEVYKSFEINENSKVIKNIKKGMEASGIKPIFSSTGGGSDANIFNQIGVPSVILGVGADRVHTKRERLCIADFVRGTEMALNIVRSIDERN
ncbi:MAG: M20/M25/M40 family metallo-hydrolase [Candidatus Margulisiibacteriota bacterium]